MDNLHGNKQLRGKQKKDKEKDRGKEKEYTHYIY